MDNFKIIIWDVLPPQWLRFDAALGVGSLANAEWMFETTREYVMNRKSFGSTVSSLQVIMNSVNSESMNVCQALVSKLLSLYDDLFSASVKTLRDF